MRAGDIMRKLGILLGVNFKLAIMKPTLISMGYLMLIPIIHGISNLEVKYVAEVLEKFVSVIGIILIVPLCSPELNSQNVKESIYGRVFTYGKVIAIRIFMAVIMLCFLISFFSIILMILHCEFPIGLYIIGTLITAGTIGMIGLTMTIFSNNLISGYVFSVSYFLICWTGIINEDNPVYLFSMVNNRLQQKGILLIVIALCIVVSSIRLYQKNNNYEFC